MTFFPEHSGNSTLGIRIYLFFEFSCIIYHLSLASKGIHLHLPQFQAWSKQRPFPRQSYVVFTIIGTMASSDFSHHIVSDFPFYGYTSTYSQPLLYSKTGFYMRWCETSPVPIWTFLTFHYPYAEEGWHRISRFFVSPTAFAPSLQARPSCYLPLRRSSIHFMLRTANLLTLSSTT